MVGAQCRPSRESLVLEEGLRFGQTSAAETQWVTPVYGGAFRLVSRSLLGVTLRACPPPCGRLALLLRLRRPPGYGFRLRRTLPKCSASALGGGASRLASPSVTLAGHGQFNETEIATMYQNEVTLIGFPCNHA